MVRLTNEPGSASLYFNQNGYTPDGKYLIYSTAEGVSTLDLETRATKAIAHGRVRVIEAGRRTPSIDYVKEGSVWLTRIDTGESRLIGGLPKRGSVATINADETLIGGTYVEGDGQDYVAPHLRNTTGQGHSLDQPVNKEQMMEPAACCSAANGPVRNGCQDRKYQNDPKKSTDWINHLLFSPTDPSLLLYCHEGPWHKVDRIWTIRTRWQSEPVHPQTNDGSAKIAGREFWSKDGQTIWYDLQTPRGEDFWVAGYRVATGERKWYHLERNEWSIHFNVTRDEHLFCGDGGDPGQVARAPDGQWVYLFRAELIPNDGIASKELVQPGVFRSERLVNMSKHNYRLEPNVSFTPDERWVVFRSNMFAPTYVFAVEVAKAAN